MGLPETLLIVLGAAVLMALVLGMVLRSAVQARPGLPDADAARDVASELDALKANLSEARQKLAVEELRSSRVATLETELADLGSRLEAARDARAGTEAQLAGAREALAATGKHAADLEVRLQAGHDAATETGRELSALAMAKAAVDEALSARVAEVSALEVNLLDVHRRLEASVAGHKELEGRRTTLRDDKSVSDAALSAKTEAAKNGDERVVQLQLQMAKIAADLSGSQEAAAELRTINATVRETLDQERKAADEKLALLTAARTEMGQQFRTLAEEVMARHGENFSKLNREQIDGILTPLRDKLAEFEKNVQTSHVESVRERATLAEQIRNIADTGAAMGRETKGLTEALRGRSQVQGAWGEMVLSTVLERSGLRPDAEYTAQKSFRTEDGDRLRPDVVINLPGGQQLVVDSKVSLTAFECLVSAGSDGEREDHLRGHLASVRSHIAALGSKDYHLATGTTLDYVIMFVPIEGALAAALQADPTLLAFAAEKNVAITTPTTLMVALRTVANVWQVERRNQNAEDIANRAGKLYEKFAGFAVDLTAVGDSLSRARSSYEQAVAKLTTGKGNVIRQLEQLKAMGGRTSKSLPASLLDAAEGSISLAITTHTVETDVKVELTTQTGHPHDPSDAPAGVAQPPEVEPG